MNQKEKSYLGNKVTNNATIINAHARAIRVKDTSNPHLLQTMGIQLWKTKGGHHPTNKVSYW